MPEPDRQPDAVPVLELQDVSVFYGAVEAVRGTTMPTRQHRITAIIGPSGCGKSSILRALNRMNDLTPGARVSGRVCYHGRDIYTPEVDPIQVRRQVGMVFQKPNPFPKSIYDNVAYGLRSNGLKRGLQDRVEQALTDAALWDIVSHNLQQAARISHATAFFTTEIDQRRVRYGRLIEFGQTDRIFTSPADPRTEAYVTGRFGEAPLARAGRGMLGAWRWTSPRTSCWPRPAASAGAWT